MEPVIENSHMLAEDRFHLPQETNRPWDDPRAANLETAKPAGVTNGLSTEEYDVKFNSSRHVEAVSTSGQKLMISKSIKVMLEQTEEPDQYMLNTNDPELRALLKEGFVRSSGGEIRMKSSRFSDIVLKKQFTAFDRQNKDSLPSFHGFFSLFWIGVALLILRVAANNWRAYGSVLGKNEILRLMTSRDLILLGIMDCLMMSLGVVSVLLQKLVLKGYLSWGKSGWILQNLWQAIFLGGFIAMLMKQHRQVYNIICCPEGV
jgi:hypothetical protein